MSAVARRYFSLPTLIRAGESPWAILSMGPAPRAPATDHHTTGAPEVHEVTRFVAFERTFLFPVIGGEFHDVCISPFALTCLLLRTSISRRSRSAGYVTTNYRGSVYVFRTNASVDFVAFAQKKVSWNSPVSNKCSVLSCPESSRHLFFWAKP